MKTSLTYLVIGGLSLLAGLWMVLPLGRSPDAGFPSGWSYLAGFMLLLIGAGLLLVGWRRHRRAQSSDPEEGRLEEIKNQVIWRSMAQGGRVTASEVAAQGGLPLPEVERALLSLVAEGRAEAEPGDGGQIFYRVEAGKTRSPDTA